MRPLSLLTVGVVALAGCSSVPPAPPTAAAQAELQELIAGKAAAQPISCLRQFRTNQMITIDDNTIAFRDGRTVYVNHLRGGCNGLSSGFYTLITKSFGSSSMCSGDIARVADLSSGITVGSCVLGDFTPYRATS